MTDKELKSKFIDFEQLPFSELKNKEKSVTGGTIIKSDQVKLSGKVRKIPLSHEEGEPQVVYHEKDGRVDIIEFICTCGNTVKVKVKYHDEEEL